MTLGLVVTTLSACGGGSLGTSGAAGTLGTGEGATGGTVTVGIAGAVGTGGGAVGGTGGTGGTPPACGGGGGPDVVELMVIGADGMPVAARVTATVTVTAIESCADVTCSSPTTTAASRIALAGAASQQWTLYLRNTAMPSDVIKVGDTFDLTIDASEDQTLYRSVDQTVVLSRYGHVIVFAATLSRFGGPPLPNLLPFQIAVSDEGATCESASLGCRQRPHALRVSVATYASVAITGGRTGRIGPFSITNGRMDAVCRHRVL